MTLSAQETALQARPARATAAAERGRLHAALAVHACQALAYRRMNVHEEASADAFAEASQPLRQALANYRAAITAFGKLEVDAGLALLRLARPAIVAQLGDDHPYSHRVSSTLAGRLAGTDTLEERLAKPSSSKRCCRGMVRPTEPSTDTAARCCLHRATRAIAREACVVIPTPKPARRIRAALGRRGHPATATPASSAA